MSNNKNTKQKLTPKDIDYWLPASYQELMEDENENFSEIGNLSFESHKPVVKGNFSFRFISSNLI